ncbi:MAG TPA: SGNH/GDSL hydrolase family protein [Vicinamibacterales bacterium]
MRTLQHGSASVTRWVLAALLTVGVIGAQPAAAQSRFSGIVVFGTSLSDPGNAFVLVGDQSTPPDFMLNPLLIPNAPYAKGGHHFSNGATWIEQYARAIGLGDSVKAALATTDPAVTNYAVGAARSYNDGSNFNLTQQVDAFLLRAGGVAPSQALYVIEMGGNDVRDAFALYAAGGNGGPVLSQALGSIASNIQRLYAAGAREFLVWSAPNIALTPAIRSLGPAAGGLATQVTVGFNASLSQVLAQLTLALPGATFSRLDAYALLGAIVADPSAFDLTNVTTACITPSVAPFNCKQPVDFLFWDGIHPTKAGHAILAREAAEVIR